MKGKAIRTMAAIAVVALCACIAQAGSIVTWDIDETQSSLTLAIPDFNITVSGLNANVRFRDQVGGTGNGGPWSIGNTAFIDGTLSSEYTETLVQEVKFLGVSLGDMVGLNSGSYRPNPAAYDPGTTSSANPDGTYLNTTTAAAVFGAKVRIFALGGFVNADAAFVSFNDVNYDLISATLPITGVGSGTFAANTLDFGIRKSGINADGVSAGLAGQVIPDTLATIDNLIETNTAPLATLANLGGELRQITIPLSIPIIIDLDGTIINGTATGQIVATATVPEPSTLVMCVMGISCFLLPWTRRQLRRS